MAFYLLSSIFQAFSFERLLTLIVSFLLIPQDVISVMIYQNYAQDQQYILRSTVISWIRTVSTCNFRIFNQKLERLCSIRHLLDQLFVAKLFFI